MNTDQIAHDLAVALASNYIEQCSRNGDYNDIDKSLRLSTYASDITSVYYDALKLVKRELGI